MPLAVALGGWSLSLAVWAVPAVLAVAVWTPIARRLGRPVTAEPRTGLPWCTGFARLTAGYEAGTSLMFYGWLTWLAPYYEAHGWPPARAGLLLAVWSVAQIPAALLAPAMAERRRRGLPAGLTLIAAGAVQAVGIWRIGDRPR